MEEGPRQAQALAFPAREGIPQLAHGGIIALGQAHDEVVNRRLAAGLLDLGIGGVPFGDAQIAADGIVEEDGFLGDIAFHPAQVLGVDLIDGPIRDCDAALPGLPETHEQLEQCGFAAAAASHNAGDAAFGDGKGQILEDGFLPVGESHMADLRAGEGNLFPAGHILHGGGVLQQIQHAVARRKGVLQRAAQIGQRHHRAEGTHQGNGGKDHAGKVHGAPQAEQNRGKEHGQVKEQNHGVGAGRVAAGGAFHALLVPGQRVAAGGHPLQALSALTILPDLIQAAQAVQHIAAQLARTVAEPQPIVTAEPGGQHRDHNAHHQVGRQRQKAQRPVKAADEETENGAEQHRNGNGGDGVGVKYLQQLNVRGDDRDEVALVPPFQLGGAEAAQGAEHLVPNKGQKFERNVMVAGLLPVAQRSAQQRKDDHGGKQRRKGQRCARAQHFQNAVSAENGQEGRAEMSRQPHSDGQNHKPGQRFDKARQTDHDGKSASLFHAKASFR